MYLLDSNIFIEAKNRYYGFDIAPGFWDWLGQLFREGHALSIDAVYQELTIGNDDLNTWARSHKEYFVPIDQSVASKFEPLSTWAASRNYTPDALAEFSSNAADYLIVATGAAHGYTVVTHERPRPKSGKRVKIPDACDAMGVTWIDTFTMLKDTGIRLTL